MLCAPLQFRLDYALSREQTNKKGGKMYIQDKVRALPCSTLCRHCCPCGAVIAQHLLSQEGMWQLSSQSAAQCA